MITKKVSIEGIPYDTYEVQVLLADGSLRGELYNEDTPDDRQKSVVIVEPWPFDLSAEELNELNPQPIEMI